MLITLQNVSNVQHAGFPCYVEFFGHHLYGDDICFANFDFFTIDSANTSEWIFMKL